MRLRTQVCFRLVMGLIVIAAAGSGGSSGTVPTSPKPKHASCGYVPHHETTNCMCDQRVTGPAYPCGPGLVQYFAHFKCTAVLDYTPPCQPWSCVDSDRRICGKRGACESDFSEPHFVQSVVSIPGCSPSRATCFSGLSALPTPPSIATVMAICPQALFCWPTIGSLSACAWWNCNSPSATMQFFSGTCWCEAGCPPNPPPQQPKGPTYPPLP